MIEWETKKALASLHAISHLLESDQSRPETDGGGYFPDCRDDIIGLSAIIENAATYLENAIASLEEDKPATPTDDLDCGLKCLDG